MRARNFTIKINGVAANLQSAVYRIKPIAEIPCLISGNTATRPAVDADVTAKWPVGNYPCDLHTVIDGIGSTYIAGTFPVRPTAHK